MKKKRNEKEYRRIIWDSIIYLLFHRKDIAKDLASFQSDEWGSKFVRFGTALNDPEYGYTIDFKISE